MHRYMEDPLRSMRMDLRRSERSAPAWLPAQPFGDGANVAATETRSRTTRSHVPVPAQAPDQPANDAGTSSATSRPMMEPGANGKDQIPRQVDLSGGSRAAPA